VTRKTVLLLLFIFLLVPNFVGESAPLLRKRVTEVRLALVATDQNNRPLRNLSPADITVLDDGRPISHFELRSADEFPLRLAIVLDLSDSTQKSWPSERTALVASLQQLMRPKDKILLLTFSNDIGLQRTLQDPSKLDTILHSSSVGGLTALYDSLYRTCEHNLFNGDAEPHRSAMILFSDGEDDLSRHSLNDTISRAQTAGITIYALATHNPKRPRQGDFVLRDLSTATGGRDFVVKDLKHLQAALSTINSELRSSYMLYYHPPDESGVRAFRRVYVLSTQSNGSHMRSRAGYFTAP
jgi:VWFA-related protein